MGLFRRIIEWVDDLFTPEPERKTHKRKPKRRRARRPRAPRRPPTDPTGDPWPDIPADFKAYDSEAESWARVVRWSDIGMSDWQEVDSTSDFRMAKNADLYTVEIVAPDGATVYRTFKGPMENLQRTIDYWKSIGSL